MILPELLIHRNRLIRESSGAKEPNGVKREVARQTWMTINVLATMAVAFSLGMAALLVLAGSTLSQSMVAGAVATGVAFVNLMRRPPDESLEGQ